MAALMVVGFYLSVIIVSGFIGNVAVIVAFFKFKKLRTANNYLIMNLSVSDLAMAVIGTPMSCSSSFAGRWLYGTIGCSYYGFINYYCGCISLNTFAAIAVYRHLVVLRHLPNRKINISLILKVIIALHVFTLICTTPPLFGWNEFILEGFKTQCDINYRNKSPTFVSYVAFMFIVLFVVPLSIIIYCYSSIFAFLRRRTADQVSQSVSLQLRSSARVMERRTTIMMLVCLVLYLAAWTPYCVVSLWSVIGDHRRVTPAVSAAPALIAKSCIVFNPIVYGVMSPQYRRAFQELFRLRRAGSNRPSSNAANSGCRLQGNSGTELAITTMPSNADPKISSQDNDTPDVNANEPDVADQAANQDAVISDVGRYRRSRMKRTHKISRSASTSSADNTPRASLSVSSSSSSNSSSDRSCISLDSVDVKSLRAIAFAKNQTQLPRSRSETRFGPKPRTRLYKRSLRHQSSDTVVVIGGMLQETKIARSPSESIMSAASSVEQVSTPKPIRAGPHPKKKMLRSHSESAIDVTLLRTVKNNMKDGAPGTDLQASGIVCSNEDLYKILSDARKQKVGRRRNNTIVCRLDATPELPQENSSPREAETCLNENIAQLVPPAPKNQTQAPAAGSSPRSWSTRHNSLRTANSYTTAAADLNTRAMDLHGWSPKHSLINANQNSNSNFSAKMFSRAERRSCNSFSRNRATAQCPTELEPMLGSIESDHDDNGNIVAEEEEEEEEEVEEVKVEPVTRHSPVSPSMPTIPDIENQPSTSSAPSTESGTPSIVCTGFDPELLGQAIERHLSVAKVSPTHENKPARSRSGSIKSMWTQNRISNLVTRFPFRRDNSTTAAV